MRFLTISFYSGIVLLILCILVLVSPLRDRFDIALRPTEITTVIHYRNGDKQYLDYTLRLRSAFTNTWYVVVGYFGATQWDQAQSLAKAYQQKGFKAAAVDTNSGEFPNFDRGVVMVVIGPGSKVQANSLLKKIPVLGGKPYIQQAAKA